MIFDNLEIILWQFQKVLKFSILNAKALATMLPLFSIVCAFATRLLPIVCSKRVASASRFYKILFNQEISYKISKCQLSLDLRMVGNLELILHEFF